MARPDADKPASADPRGTGWADGETAEFTGRPLDSDRFDDGTRPEQQPRRGPWRALLWLTGLLALVLVAGLGLRATNLWPDFANPFKQETTDRSQPVLLRSIQDLSRFVAASGNFEVVIDVQENRRYIPDVLFNERTLFVAAGSVDAYVDFSNVTEGALVVDETNKTVEIKLPAPQLEKPSIDNDRSYVFARQQGAFNRLRELFGGDPNKQQQLYQLAEAKIGEAAQASELGRRAQENTDKMLRGMMASLGYTATITFAGV